MGRQRTPLKPAEVEAIKKAEAEWLRWRQIDSICPPDIADKQVYTKVKRASKIMLEALNLVLNDVGSRQSSRLLATMQEIQLFRAGQVHYLHTLENMVEPLQLVGWACERLGGRGGRLDPAVIRWVGLAADAWIHAGNPKPTAKGRFFRALTEVEVTKSVPGLTEDRVKEALALWRRAHQISGDETPRLTHSE